MPSLAGLASCLNPQFLNPQFSILGSPHTCADQRILSDKPEGWNTRETCTIIHVCLVMRHCRVTQPYIEHVPWPIERQSSRGCLIVLRNDRMMLVDHRCVLWWHERSLPGYCASIRLIRRTEGRVLGFQTWHQPSIYPRSSRQNDPAGGVPNLAVWSLRTSLRDEDARSSLPCLLIGILALDLLECPSIMFVDNI